MKRIEDLHPESRVWIYQADRFLNESESNSVLDAASEFIDEWTAHGNKLDAAAALFHNRFLVFAANEKQAAASGCGIDKSVNFVKDIGNTLDVDFFQRTQVIYRKNGELAESPLNVFWASRKAGIISDDTPVFDTTIRTLAELLNQLEKPFSQSWHAEMWIR